jgi:hypothetical protein
MEASTEPSWDYLAIMGIQRHGVRTDLTPHFLRNSLESDQSFRSKLTTHFARSCSNFFKCWSLANTLESTSGEHHDVAIPCRDCDR